MAQRDILKEFLVKLGFQTDEKSLKRFNEGVVTATKGVTALVGAIQAASLTVAAGVAKFAANMEALYFSASKFGSTATNVKAVSKAVQNLTGNGEDAVQSLSNLARWIRNTPGAEGFLRSLGVATRDARGNMRDTAEIMADLGTQLAGKPYAVARQYADLLGIGEDTLRAILSGDFAAELKKQRTLLKDSGYDEATRKAHEFMQKLRELQTRVEAVGVTIGASLLKALGPQMEQTAKWFEANADQIAQVVSTIGTAIIRAGEIIMPILDKIAEGWRLIFQFARDAGEAISRALPKSAQDWIGEKTARVLAWFGNKEAQTALAANAVPGYSAPAASTQRPAASGGKTIDAMAFFQRMGWTRDQAAGIVANLQHESNMDPRAVGDNGKAYGIAQWHPDRQRNFERWAGKSIRDSNLEEQLAFVNYELTQGAERRAGALLRATQNAAQAGEVVSREYERPLLREAEAAKRAQSAVSIAQQTTIQVSGGGDPAATGRAVANEQGRVNQALVRNMQVAVN